MDGENKGGRPCTWLHRVNELVPTRYYSTKELAEWAGIGISPMGQWLKRRGLKPKVEMAHNMTRHLWKGEDVRSFKQD